MRIDIHEEEECCIVVVVVVVVSVDRIKLLPLLVLLHAVVVEEDR